MTPEQNRLMREAASRIEKLTQRVRELEDELGISKGRESAVAFGLRNIVSPGGRPQAGLPSGGELIEKMSAANKTRKARGG